MFNHLNVEKFTFILSNNNYKVIIIIINNIIYNILIINIFKYCLSLT